MAANTQYTKVLVPFSFDGQQPFEQMREDVIEVQEIMCPEAQVYGQQPFII